MPQPSATHAKRPKTFKPASAHSKTACEKTSIPMPSPKANRKPVPYASSNFWPRIQRPRRIPTKAVVNGKMKAMNSFITLLFGHAVGSQGNQLHLVIFKHQRQIKPVGLQHFR